MQEIELTKDIYWVGAIDWNLRNFHGYLTQRGSTYNAYLIIDEHITLIDTVKYYLFDEMLKNIQEIIDPAKIDYIISNHTEMDHSGSILKILQYAKNAQVVCSPNGEKGLRRHFKTDLNFKIVENGEVLNIGKRDLSFVLAPMVHWPDSMVTYCPEEKILFSNDAFGQHIATAERFDDEIEDYLLQQEAAKYYANIVLPFGKQVNKLLDAAATLEIKTIAPSHGIIWRNKISEIIELYKKWANNVCEEKAVIVYDTMWDSTKSMANTISEAFEEKKIPYELFDLKTDHISDLMTEILNAKYICVGSPTLNNGLLPTVASFLTYLKGLAPKNRIGIAFGSYGWGGQSISEIEDILENNNFTVPLKGLKTQYIPDEQDLEDIKNKVKEIL